MELTGVVVQNGVEAHQGTFFSHTHVAPPCEQTRVSTWGGGCRGFRASTGVGSLQRIVTPLGWQLLGRNASMTGQHARLVMARPDQPDVSP